jgi:LysR family hydrogen peroxide-inducible transcriptional activator
MNHQQLEYIVAVDNHRHFAKAAGACFVTQPTLSMMINKLEEELGVKIFDRSRHPVMPTPIGSRIITQARNVLSAAERIKDIIDEEKGMLHMQFRLGIIPTIAPYFLPVFLPQFVSSYPKLQLNIREMVTSQVIEYLKTGQIDGAILATPLDDPQLAEYPIYYEKFFSYISEKESGFARSIINVDDIDAERLWLLEEGHCFRSQIIEYCDIRKRQNMLNDEGFVYEAGSIETLVRMVDRHGGMTIVPEMALRYLSTDQLKSIRPFTPPVPVREVSLVTRKDFVRMRIIEVFRETSRRSFPGNMLERSEKEQVVGIHIE